MSYMTATNAGNMHDYMKFIIPNRVLFVVWVQLFKLRLLP